MGSTVQTIDPLCQFSFSLELSSAGVAPLPPSYHKLLNETVTTFAVFPSCMYLLDGEDNDMLSVPISTSDLPGGGCRCFHVVWLRIVVFFQRRVLSLLFCLVVLPARCVLDDPRLFGLTLRPTAPVCCCRRDSLARGRLAFEQEAVRGLPSSSSFDSAGCAWWFQEDSEKCLFMRC